MKYLAYLFIFTSAFILVLMIMWTINYTPFSRVWDLLAVFFAGIGFLTLAMGRDERKKD